MPGGCFVFGPSAEVRSRSIPVPFRHPDLADDPGNGPDVLPDHHRTGCIGFHGCSKTVSRTAVARPLRPSIVRHPGPAAEVRPKWGPVMPPATAAAHPFQLYWPAHRAGQALSGPPGCVWLPRMAFANHCIRENPAAYARSLDCSRLHSRLHQGDPLFRLEAFLFGCDALGGRQIPGTVLPMAVTPLGSITSWVFDPNRVAANGRQMEKGIDP